LFDELELRKNNLSTEGSINSEENKAKAKLQITNLALNSFKKADDEDRSGNATKKTARTFHASSTFFEVLQCFGDLDEDIEKKIKYAKWKAADIMKAIREGRTPVPGSPVASKKEFDDELPDSNDGLNLSNPDMNGGNPNINQMNDNFGRMNISSPTNYNNNMGGIPSNDPTNYNSPQRPQFNNNVNNNEEDELNNLMNEMSPTGGSMNNNFPPPNNMNNQYPPQNNNMNNQYPPPNNNMNNQYPPPNNNMNNQYPPPNNYNQNNFNNNNGINAPPMLPPRVQNNNQNFNNGAPSLPPRQQQGGFDESMFPTTPTNKPGSNFSSSSNLGSNSSMNGRNGSGSPYNNNNNNSNNGSTYNKNNNNTIPNLPTVPKNNFKEDPFATSSVDEDSYSDDEVDYPYDPAVLMDAQKHSRFAISALQYDDVQTAIKNLRIALNLLEPYQNIQGNK
jgi:vacuolar protein sorting-associated protein VTA1